MGRPPKSKEEPIVFSNKYKKRENRPDVKLVTKKSDKKIKLSNKFSKLFGNGNPFAPSKYKKTLIATPSKFEIRR